MSLQKLLAALMCFVFINAKAQTTTIKGNIKDTLNKNFLANASISIIKAKDSILVKHTRSNADGSFSLQNVPKGNYVLMVTYPKYADFFDNLDVNVNDNQPIDLKTIPLISRISLLQEVIVQGKVAAIRMKGDTLEFKADSFKTGPNANVQDLLKRLPGISVNTKGEIVAQGVKVEKVLVDGEEFFSDDPAVVTKNLRSDAVDKVQVFDKKSDQATFTGIDDGEKTRTINLELKQDKKKGYFGKAEIGHSFDQFRYGKLMANAFKAKSKIAGYITNDNTSYESLDWNERTNYGEDLNRTTQVNDDGGMSMWSSGDNFSWGQGFPTSTTAGLHFSQKWNKDKNNSINTYQHNNLNVFGTNTSTTQTLANDSSFILRRNNQSFNNQKTRHRLRSTNEWNIDSSSTLKVIVTGSNIKTISKNVTDGNTTNFKNAIINTQQRETNTVEEEKMLVGNINYRKRFKKAGRTMSANVDFDASNKENKISLLAVNSFFQGTPFTNTVDQFKTNNEDKFNVRSRISFTEQLWKNTFLELNYRYETSRNNAERFTFEKPIGGDKYNMRIDSLSNHFIFNNTTNMGGFNFRYNKKKINASIGAAYGTVNFAMEDLLTNKPRNISFNNFQPQANFNYQIKKQRRLSLSYNGRNRNPNLFQIQPIIDNIDPLNITIGNPNLKQEFTHNISFNFSDYKVLKSKNLYISSNFSTTQNAITNSTILDTSTGKITSQAINVDGNYNFNMWANYGFELFPSFNLNFQFNPNINRFINVVNGQRNENNSESYNFQISSSYWGDKLVNYWFGIGPTYNINKSSINPFVNKFWSINGNYDFEFKFKKIKMYINVDGEVNVYQRTSVFANQQNVFRINSSIRKSLDKAENWQVQLRVHDILNQNQSINRNINNGMISENTQQAIQRYAMLSLTYNFSKNGKPSTGW